MKLNIQIPEKTIQALLITHPVHGVVKQVNDFDKPFVTVKLENGELELIEKKKLSIRQFDTFHCLN